MSRGVETPLAVESAAFRQELLRLVRRRLANESDAEDITQDVMLRLAERPDAAPEDTPMVWLQRVVANASIDYFRRREREARALGRALDEERVQAGSAEQGEADRMREGIARCLAPFLARLDAQDQEALRLTDLGTLTQREAADQLGVPYSTLKSRVQRARGRLKDSLQDCCRFEVDARGAPIDAIPHSAKRAPRS